MQQTVINALPKSPPFWGQIPFQCGLGHYFFKSPFGQISNLYKFNYFYLLLFSKLAMICIPLSGSIITQKCQHNGTCKMPNCKISVQQQTQ